MTLAAQLRLPLYFVPDPLRGHGLRAAHVYPLVGRRTGPGKTFWSGRVPANRAWDFGYIVLDDAGATWATMTFDCDNRLAMAAGLDDLPPYSWFVRTRRGGHVSWALAVPVGKHQAARAAPEAYLSAVAEYYHHELGADPAFGACHATRCIPKPTPFGGGASRTRLMSCRQSFRSVGASRALPKPGLAETAIYSWRPVGGDRGVAALTMAHALNRDVADAYGREPLPIRKSPASRDRSRDTDGSGNSKGTSRPGWRGKRRARQNRLARHGRPARRAREATKCFDRGRPRACPGGRGTGGARRREKVALSPIQILGISLCPCQRLIPKTLPIPLIDVTAHPAAAAIIGVGGQFATPKGG